jgi:hypothetical protein
MRAMGCLLGKTANRVELAQQKKGFFFFFFFLQSPKMKKEVEI